MAKKLSITPLHDRVIVKPAPAEEKTAGGIIIPDTAKEKPQKGVVVAVDAGLKVMAALNSRPIDSVMVSVNSAGVVVHVDVFRLMVNVVTCQSPLGALEF